MRLGSSETKIVQKFKVLHFKINQIVKLNGNIMLSLRKSGNCLRALLFTISSLKLEMSSAHFISLSIR